MPNGQLAGFLQGFIGGIGEHGQSMRKERIGREDRAMTARLDDLQRLAAHPDISDDDRQRYLQEADDIFNQMIGGGKGSKKAGGGQGHFSGFFNQILQQLGGGSPSYRQPSGGGAGSAPGMARTPPFNPAGSSVTAQPAGLTYGQPQGASVATASPETDWDAFKAQAGQPAQVASEGLPMPPGAEGARFSQGQPDSSPFANDLAAPARPYTAGRASWERPSEFQFRAKQDQDTFDRDWDLYAKRLSAKEGADYQERLIKARGAQQLRLQAAQQEAKETLDINKLARTYLAEGQAETLADAQALAAPFVREAAEAKIAKDWAQIDKWKSDASNVRQRIAVAKENLAARWAGLNVQQQRLALDKFKLDTEDERKFVEQLDAQIARGRADSNSWRALMQTYMRNGMKQADAELKAKQDWERNINGLKDMRDQIVRELQPIDLQQGLPAVPGAPSNGAAAGAAKPSGQAGGKVRQVTRGALLMYAQQHHGGDINKAKAALDADAASKGIKVEIVPGK